MINQFFTVSLPLIKDFNLPKILIFTGSSILIVFSKIKTNSITDKSILN